MKEYFKVVTPFRLSIKTSSEGLLENDYDMNPFILFYDTVEPRIVKAFPGSLGICVYKAVEEAVEFQKHLRFGSMIIKILSDSEEKIPTEICGHPSSLKELIYFYMNDDSKNRIKNKEMWLDSVVVSPEEPFSYYFNGIVHTSLANATGRC